MPKVPEIFKRRNILFHLWCLPCAFANTDQKNQQLILDHVKSIPFHTRGPRHGPQQWQYDQWKAKRRNERTRKRIRLFLFTDGLQTNDTKNNHAWTEECRYLNYTGTVNITCFATWPERSKYLKSKREKPNTAR